MSKDCLQKVDNNIGKLLENFGGLVKCSKIRDKTHNTREAFQTSLHATSLVQAAEALLNIIAELKFSAALGDFSTMNGKINKITPKLKNKCEVVHQATEKLCEDLSTGLDELENHYYASRWRINPNNITNC